MSEIKSAVDELSISSTHEEDDLPFMTSYIKQDITDGLKICANTLESLKICEGTPNVIISNKAILLGKKMAEACIDVMKDFDFYEDHDLFLPEEDVSADELEEPAPCNSSPEKADTSSTYSSSPSVFSQAESDCEPENKKHKIVDFVPLETKIKIVNMIREHPKWRPLTNVEEGRLKVKVS